MANEYRVYTVAIRAAGAGEDSDAHVYSVEILAAGRSGQPVDARVFSTQVLVAGRSGEVTTARVYTTQILVMGADRQAFNQSTLPDSTDTFAPYVIGTHFPIFVDGSDTYPFSLTVEYLPIFVDGSATFPLAYESGAVPATTIDPNPYRPDIPPEVADDSPNLYDYLREQSETLRDQHNLIQAGDTTFPWELTAQSTESKLYTLGAETRFFHETYGLIRAKFVEYDSEHWLDEPFLGVGHHKKRDRSYVVSNMAEYTESELLVGLNLPYTANLAGSWGWAQTHGRGLQSILVEADSLRIGLQFGWDFANKRATAESGVKNLGMVLQPELASEVLNPANESFSPKQWRLPAGSWFCDVVGFTDQYYRDLAEEVTAPLDVRLTVVEQQLAQNEVDYGALISSLSDDLGSFQQTFQFHEQSNVNTFSAIANRLLSIETAIGNLSAGGSGGSVDLSGLQAEVSALQISVNALQGDVATNTYNLNQLSADQLALSSSVSSLATTMLTRVGSVTPSTDNAIVRWDGATGLVVQDSGIIVDDGNNISGVSSIRDGTGLIYNPRFGVGTIGTDWPATNSAVIEVTESLVAVTAGNRLVSNATLTATGTASATSLSGFVFLLNWDSTGTLTALTGINGTVRNLNASGTVTTATGLVGRVRNVGTIDTGYSLRASNPTNTGTINTLYALRLESHAIGGVTTAWGVYQAGPDNNAFEGKVRIGGSTAPTNELSVTGSADISGSLSVADESYGGSWDGSLQVPTKNAIYDKIQSMIVAAPASASSTGVAGQLAYDSDYFYVCVATDTWKRVAIATW